MKESFICQNRIFWSAFPAKAYNKKVLIEEPSIPMINHANAIFSIILNQAKSLTPVWLCSNAEEIELLKSYVPTAEFMSFPKASWFYKIKMMLSATWKFLIMYLTKDVLSFSYDGVKYGGIVYDTYLAARQVGTVREIDIHLWRIVYNCIRRHENIRRSLSGDKFEAVLVGHQIGSRSGIMLRAALRHGCKGYVRLGHHESSFQCLETLDEICGCQDTPTPEIIDEIIAELGSEFDNVYRSILKKEISGKGSKDGAFAFSTDNKYYNDRESFSRDFKLDGRKKNVFIMLHALNDYPHSRKWILFKDYYEWLIETLKFAKKDDNVNWIFKQHPSIKFYITKDVSFDSLFSNSPKNVIYINENSQIDTRSLLYCADLVVTCIGSAGVELPAMGGIPSLTAGDNFYTGLGFALEPKTKKEYFRILCNARNIRPLTPEQQKRAQAAYMYIYQFSRVCMPACPAATLADEKDGNQQSWYWEKIAESYRTSGEVIKDLIRAYINDVAKPDFKQLSSLEGYYSTKQKKVSEDFQLEQRLTI